MIPLDELLSYELRDFILFTADTYYRQYAQHNAQWWPLLAIAAMVATGFGWRLRAQPIALLSALARLSGALLIAAAVTFLLQRFGQIFQPAPLLAGLLIVQGLMMLFIFPLLASRPAPASSAGTATTGPVISQPQTPVAWLLLALALVFHPLITLTQDRPAASLELFGLAADPSMIASLGMALLIAHPLRWLLLLIPTIWCLLTIPLYLGMETPQALFTPGLTLLLLAKALLGARKPA